MADKTDAYLKEADRKMLRKKAEPKKRTAARKKPGKTLGKKWDDLTEGPFGTVIYIILGFLIAVAVQEGLKPILHTDTPVVAVFSESMVPTFEKGDLIFVQGGGEVKTGDIIVFDSSYYKYPIIHRVISTSEEGVRTKGDHNSAADPWVITSDKIKGKTVLRIPYLGWVKVGVYELLKLV